MYVHWTIIVHNENRHTSKKQYPPQQKINIEFIRKNDLDVLLIYTLIIIKKLTSDSNTKKTFQIKIMLMNGMML